MKSSSSVVGSSRSAFTLIELLVTVSIIALLIGILVPGLNSARNSAKNVKTSNAFKTIGEGLQAFRVDNEKQYSQTNGYPSSSRVNDPAVLGEGAVFGAHRLFRALIGKDSQGFIPRRIVPKSLQNRNDRDEQVRWYDPMSGDPAIDRIPPYLSPERLDFKKTRDLPGRRPRSLATFFSAAEEDKVFDNPVFVDAFGFPILYYAANTHGKTIASRAVNQKFGRRRLKGIYVHEDNEGFTGSDGNEGWRFKGTQPHPIQEFGPSREAELANIDDYSGSFTAYIHDHETGELTENNNIKVIRPLRSDSYLLIAAGKDGRYGTSDDVVNFK